MIAVLDKVKHASTHVASLPLVPFCCLSLWPKENCFPLLYFSMFGVSGLVDFVLQVCISKVILHLSSAQS